MVCICGAAGFECDGVGRALCLGKLPGVQGWGGGTRGVTVWGGARVRVMCGVCGVEIDEGG